MPNPPLDTTLLDRAVCYAVRAHAGTQRRGKGFPYIVHPLEAVAIVATVTSDQELLAAAALHDTVEDTDATVEDIRREFGGRIASLVTDETDPFPPQTPWRVRKQAAIDRVAKASRDAKIVALGDKLSNMRAMALDYEALGESLWSRFHADSPDDIAWYYRGQLEALRELEGTAPFREFETLINQLWKR